MADVTLTLRPEPMAVREALASMRSGLEGLSISDDDLDSLELVLAEVLNNVLEHALAARSDGQINVLLRAGPQTICVEVVDDGAPMPRGRLPAGTCPDPAVGLGDLPEGGFGWFIIRSLTCGLDYRREKGLNHLRFEMALGVGGAPSQGR